MVKLKNIAAAVLAAAAAAAPALALADDGWRRLTMQEAEHVAGEYARFVSNEQKRRTVKNNAAKDWNGGLWIIGPSAEMLLAFNVETDGRRYRVNFKGSGFVSRHDGVYVTGSALFGWTVRDVLYVDKTQQIAGTGHAVQHTYGRKRGTNGYYGFLPYGCGRIYQDSTPVRIFNAAFTAWLNGNRGGAGCSPGSTQRLPRPPRPQSPESSGRR